MISGGALHQGEFASAEDFIRVLWEARNFLVVLLLQGQRRRILCVTELILHPCSGAEG